MARNHKKIARKHKANQKKASFKCERIAEGVEVIHVMDSLQATLASMPNVGRGQSHIHKSDKDYNRKGKAAQKAKNALKEHLG